MEVAMSKQTPAWLTTELEWGLHETSAPPELWDRVIAAQRVRRAPRKQTLPTLAWAAAVLVVAIGLASAYRQSDQSDQAVTLQALSGTSQIAGLHCQNPAEPHAWIRAASDTRNDLRDRTRGNISSSVMGCKLCHLD